MPAHVTVLVPFADSALLGVEMVRELRETLAAFSRFDFAIVRLARFAGRGSNPMAACTRR
jgi:hypothetical protein